MTAAGLVERVPSPTDRRISFAALTAAGRRKLEQAAEVHVRDLERVFASYTGDEVQTLDDLLGRLVRGGGVIAAEQATIVAQQAGGPRVT